MTDDLQNAIRGIKADQLTPRENLTEEQKRILVERWGPRRVADILKAKGQIPIGRLPFIYNNVDTQDLLDILANDMTTAIASAIKERN